MADSGSGIKTGSRHKSVSYAKWGYIFLIPFFATYIFFQLIPLINTIYNSFFENYRSGLKQVGPNFVGLANYSAIFTQGDLMKYFGNTLLLWVMTRGSSYRYSTSRFCRTFVTGTLQKREIFSRISLLIG